MNPIYKFTLAVTGEAEQQAFPVYRDDVEKEYELQSNQEFYRAKLSGKLIFIASDYDYIVSKGFETKFDVKIYISYNAGSTWTLYWTGQFWKTDCVFDQDDKKVTVTPEVVDNYTDILDGQEREYNLLNLDPQMVMGGIGIDKRPVVQVYILGKSKISCFLAGMSWDQDCKAITSDIDLVTNYHFQRVKVLRIVRFTQTSQGAFSPALPDVMLDYNPDLISIYGSITNGTYTYTVERIEEEGTAYNRFSIIRNSDNVTLWMVVRSATTPSATPYSVSLTAQIAAGASGNVNAQVEDILVYARYLCDTNRLESGSLTEPTYPIPDDDIVDDNKNYHYCYPYNFPDTVWFSSRLSLTPTKWGIYSPTNEGEDMYYDDPGLPPSTGISKFYPVTRSEWGRISVWFTFDVFDIIFEKSLRKQFVLKDAFPISSVISVLLAEIAPNITHEATTDYSQFLYGQNPILGIWQGLFIAPKSNVITANYDQAAQKAIITLKAVLDMLRDCFRCYWFVDEQNRFRIEHIEFFRRGGTYSGNPVVGTDLTIETVSRTGKPWAFGTSEYRFDKPEMASRYQFGWMDDVTELFMGFPIDIVSKYVNGENIEQINISSFTSDIDYILLNPGEISKDGFVLLAPSFIQDIKQRFVYNGGLNLSATRGTIWGSMYASDPKRLCTFILRVLDNNKLVYIDSLAGTGLQYRMVSFDANKGYAGGSTEWTSAAFTGFVNSSFITIEIRKENGDDITISERPSLIVRNLYRWCLPYMTIRIDDVDYTIQNAYAAFVFLQQYYFYDMPARYFKYNGVQRQALGIKKLKTQTLKFPVLTDPNPVELIKTNIGNGTIQKMSVNLLSRNANVTLNYDIE